MKVPSITVHSLATALCCHPRTISRRLTGATNPASNEKDVVSLARAATALNANETALCQFILRWEKRKDEAIDLEIAGILLEWSERHVRRKVKEGALPVIAHFGHTIRFSREDIIQFAAAR